MTLKNVCECGGECRREREEKSSKKMVFCLKWVVSENGPNRLRLVRKIDPSSGCGP